MRAKEIAQRLGVSRGSVYKMVQDNQIPFIHLPCGYRFDWEEVEEWLKKKKSP